MDYIAVFILCAISFIITSRRIEMAAILLCFSISLGPVFNAIAVNGITEMMQISIFIPALIHIARVGRKKIGVFYLFALLVFLAVQYVICGLTSYQLMLSIFRLVIIPVIVFSSVDSMVRKNIQIPLIRIYLLVNLGILYFRALVDPSFFGLVEYSLGFRTSTIALSQFRPSNLEGTIIFSIEIAVLLGIIMYQSRNNKQMIASALLCIYPLIAMRSRSGMLLAIVLSLYAFIMDKKTVYTVLLVVSAVLVLIISGENLYIMTLFTNRTIEITSRLFTVNKALSAVFNSGLNRVLFGYGIGSANQYSEVNNYIYNVITIESFHTSVFYETGLIGFSAWVGFVCSIVKKYVVKRSKDGNYYLFISIAILLINLFSTSLSASSVWTIFLMVTLYGARLNQEPVYIPDENMHCINLQRSRRYRRITQ